MQEKISRTNRKCIFFIVIKLPFLRIFVKIHHPVDTKFVSEHSETLVELDIEYRKLAMESGVPDYRRAATVGTQDSFIAGLAGLVRAALDGKTVTCGLNGPSGGRICPAEHKRCGYT